MFLDAVPNDNIPNRRIFMIMLINHRLNQPLINKIFIMAVNLNFIQIYGNLSKSPFYKMSSNEIRCFCLQVSTFAGVHTFHTLSALLRLSLSIA
jgi:hypothetical protein